MIEIYERFKANPLIKNCKKDHRLSSVLFERGIEEIYSPQKGEYVQNYVTKPIFYEIKFHCPDLKILVDTDIRNYQESDCLETDCPFNNDNSKHKKQNLNLTP